MPLQLKMFHIRGPDIEHKTREFSLSERASESTKDLHLKLNSSQTYNWWLWPWQMTQTYRWLLQTSAKSCKMFHIRGPDIEHKTREFLCQNGQGSLSQTYPAGWILLKCTTGDCGLTTQIYGSSMLQQNHKNCSISGGRIWKDKKCFWLEWMAGYQSTQNFRARVVFTDDLPHTEVAGPSGEVKSSSGTVPL